MKRFRDWLYTPNGALAYFGIGYALVGALYFWGL